MRHRPTLPTRANVKARAAVAKPRPSGGARTRPTLPSQASARAVTAVAKTKPAKGVGRRKR